jgi:hypothetical protein
MVLKAENDETARRCADRLVQSLNEAALIRLRRIEATPWPGIAFVMRMSVDSHPASLACAVAATGEPKHLWQASLPILRATRDSGESLHPVVGAPYLPGAARAAFREHGVGYVDLHGNVFISIPGRLHVHTDTERRPYREARPAVELASPKAARIVEAMLSEEDRPWKVVELSQASGASLGHVSNVRAALVGRGWAKAVPEGLVLTDRDAVAAAAGAAAPAFSG